MLRTCVASARVDGTRLRSSSSRSRLYHSRDLHEPGDDAWMAAGPSPPRADRQRTRHRRGADLTIVTFGNGVPMSLRAAERLAAEGLESTVIDLRWLAPLPVDDIVRAARETGRVLVADETRHAGGVGEGVLTALVEDEFRGPIARVASKDSFIPLGTAAGHVLLSEDEIVQAARHLAQQRRA